MSCGWANDWGSHQVWYTGRSSDEKKLWPPAKGLTGVKPKELRVKTKGSGKPGDSVCELCVCRKWGISPITSASDVKKPGFSSQWAHTPNPDCALSISSPRWTHRTLLGNTVREKQPLKAQLLSNQSPVLTDYMNRPMMRATAAFPNHILTRHF